MIAQGKVSSQEAKYPAPNGRVWNKCTLTDGTPIKAKSLAYGNGIWVCGDSTTKRNLYSTDGMNWSIGYEYPDFVNIIYDPYKQQFLGVDSNSSQIYNSSNGKTWGYTASIAASYFPAKKILFAGKRFHGINANNIYVYTNRDDSEWTQGLLSTVKTYDLCYYKGVLMAATSEGLYKNYPDIDTTWAQITTEQCSSIVHKGNYWFATINRNATSNRFTNILQWSLNGTDWTEEEFITTTTTTFTSNFNVECNDSGKYYLIGEKSFYNDKYYFLDIENKHTYNYPLENATFNYIKNVNGIFIINTDGMRYINGQSLSDTTLPHIEIEKSNITGSYVLPNDKIEDEHKGVIVAMHGGQLLYSLTSKQIQNKLVK